MVETVRRCGEMGSLVGDPGVLEGKSVVKEERNMLVDQIRWW